MEAAAVARPPPPGTTIAATLDNSLRPAENPSPLSLFLSHFRAASRWFLWSLIVRQASGLSLLSRRASISPSFSVLRRQTTASGPSLASPTVNPAPSARIPLPRSLPSHRHHCCRHQRQHPHHDQSRRRQHPAKAAGSRQQAAGSRQQAAGSMHSCPTSHSTPISSCPKLSRSHQHASRQAGERAGQWLRDG